MITTKKTIVIGIVFSIAVLASSISSAELIAIEDPVVSEITFYPLEPYALSTINFTAAITSEQTVENVRIIVQECYEGLCYSDMINESMTTTDGTTYHGTVTLTKNDATYIKYHVEYVLNGIFNTSQTTRLNLSESPNPDDNGNNGGGDHQKTPGFELLSFLVVIGLGALILRKKRLR
jgi:hypothetical protein